MTPDQLIDRLKLPHHELDKIKSLTAGFADFEKLLRKAHKKDQAGRNSFEEGIFVQSNKCVDLIASLLGESPAQVERTLLTLFGLSADQYNQGKSSTLAIVALSALVADQNP